MLVRGIAPGLIDILKDPAHLKIWKSNPEFSKAWGEQYNLVHSEPRHGWMVLSKHPTRAEAETERDKLTKQFHERHPTHNHKEIPCS